MKSYSEQMRTLLHWVVDHAEARDEERAAARDLVDQAHPADPPADPAAETAPPAPDAPPAPPAPPAAPWAAPGVAPEGGSQL